MKPYYYVHEVGAMSLLNDHKAFNELEQADNYAKWLSAKYPKGSFEVLQAISITKVITPQTFWMDGIIHPSDCRFNKTSYCCCCD